jgi:hypothetical protein
MPSDSEDSFSPRLVPGLTARSDDIELLADGDGLAIMGDAAVVDRFLVSVGLPARELDLPRLSVLLRGGSAAAHVGSTLAAGSGRWVQLTKESAKALKQFEPMKGASDDVARAVVTKNGKITGILEFARTPASLLTNPAVLAGAAGLMAQLAMQQAMDEVTDYLAVIDKKVDDVLRAQKDAVLAEMIGVGLVIEEAMAVREQVGRVSDVTWSKVQAAPMTIAQTQAYALRQLDGLAEKVERASKVGDLVRATREAAEATEEWLAVLARCFQLQDGLAVLELDRVLDAASAELDRHRAGLQVARQNRLDLISGRTEHLLARMAAAAGSANAKVLLHPTSTRAAVASSNHVSAAVLDFQSRLGVERADVSTEARRWIEAAMEVRDRAIVTGTESVDVARALGEKTSGRVRAAAGRLSSTVAERARRVRGRTDDEAFGGAAGPDEAEEVR